MNPVIGHERILEYLQGQIREDQLTHAYLFAGPQHVGKTTVAQWFTASLLCHGGQENSLFGSAAGDATAKPCRQCASCQSLTKGFHPDAHALQIEEGEHSISIEAMRNFIKHLTTSPSMGQRKVALVHDAHALTTAAANAFLKTLEESSRSTTIIIVTHQPHKLPATILSRCQIVEFLKVHQANEEVSADPFWGAARGLPGTYLRSKEAGENINETERMFFFDLLQKRPGERFLAIEPLFKKSPAHAEKKQDWQARFQVWQSAMADLLHASLQIASADGGKQPKFSATPRQCQLWLDQLYTLQQAATAPINLRAHVEAFLVSIPRL